MSFIIKWTLVWIVLLGIFAYNCTYAGKNFQGRSTTIGFLLSIFGAIGYLAFFAFIIWSFFQFVWWKPILAFVVSIVLGGSFGLFSNNLTVKAISTIISIIAVPIFIILSLIGLLQ